MLRNTAWLCGVLHVIRWESGRRGIVRDVIKPCIRSHASIVEYLGKAFSRLSHVQIQIAIGNFDCVCRAGTSSRATKSPSVKRAGIFQATYAYIVIVGKRKERPSFTDIANVVPRIVFAVIA